MAGVVFLDTSVLLNLLEVPHNNSDHMEIRDEFRRLAAEATTFVVPVTAVVETGNAIAQLPGGNERRMCMTRFVDWLRTALATTAPLAVSGVAWDESFLTALLDGGGARMSLVDFATSGVGSGDAGLLLEVERYRSKVPSATPITVWTLDEVLNAYA